MGDRFTWRARLIRYWACYPGDIDAEITAGEAAEDAWRRERDLLAG